jgi:hypothetical protein
MTLSEEKKGLLFKMLASKSIYETGVEFGLDKHYKDSTAVKNAVYRIYRQVCTDPGKFSITPETVQLVSDIVSNRSVVTKTETTLREKKDELANADFKTILLNGRQSAYRLLQSKMERIGSSKKRLDEVNVSSLAQVFGILFDKAQIIQGEATENVAVLAKVDKDMNPDDAIAMVLKSRELHQLDKDRTVKKK